MDRRRVNPLSIRKGLAGGTGPADSEGRFKLGYDRIVACRGYPARKPSPLSHSTNSCSDILSCAKPSPPASTAVLAVLEQSSQAPVHVLRGRLLLLLWRASPVSVLRREGL